MLLNHPVNVDYESVADNLMDFNLIDSFYLSEYVITVVNNNRDLSVFHVLKIVLAIITKFYVYKCPTNMGGKYYWIIYN